MKRTNASTNFVVVCLNILCLSCFLIVSGCELQTSANAASDGSSDNKLPKLRFHQPATFDLAVSRIREIVGVAVSDNPLPAPKSFRVLEVVHGSGTAAHSHYYLAKEGEQPAEPDDNHGHVTTDKKIHEVQVDMPTEFVDILRWLPEIAAAGDMGEADWKASKKHAYEIKDLFAGSSEPQDVSGWRNRIKNQFYQIDAAVMELEKLSAKQASNNESEF